MKLATSCINFPSAISIYKPFKLECKLMVHKSGESCEVSNILHKLPIVCHQITISEEARYLLIYHVKVVIVSVIVPTTEKGKNP